MHSAVTVSVSCYVYSTVKLIESHDSGGGSIKPGETRGICYFLLNGDNIIK